LINAGADASRADGSGKTPLMFAVKSGKSIIVQEIINSGANVNAAQTGGDNEIGKTSLHNAVVRKDNSEVIAILIKEGVNVNAVDENGKTALINAAFYGGLENVRILVEAGADVKQKSNTGKTALDTAVMWKRTEIVEYLQTLD